MPPTMRSCASALILTCLPLTAVGIPAQSRADEVCPAGMYWDIYTEQCLYYDIDVYIDPNPVLGPVGPVGVGGPIGPIGPGPIGPIGGPGRR